VKSGNALWMELFSGFGLGVTYLALVLHWSEMDAIMRVGVLGAFVVCFTVSIGVLFLSTRKPPNRSGDCSAHKP